MKIQSKTLTDYTNDVVAIFERYQTTGTRPWSHGTALLDLQHQLGSLTRYIMQITGDRHRQGATTSDLHGHIADELVDIIADSLFIAHELDVDIVAAWNTMLASDARKIAERARDHQRLNKRGSLETH